jgi:hypothetical protein
MSFPSSIIISDCAFELQHYLNNCVLVMSPCCIPFSICMLFISASMVRAAVLNLLLPHTEKVTSTYANLSKYIILSAFKRNLKR